MAAPRASRRHPGADRLLRLDGHGPAYRQIYRALRALILSGELGRAARLPATRELAHQLGVGRNTVLLAYRQLLGEGYAGGRIGSGTYVAPDLPDALVPAPPRGRGLAGPAASPRLAAFARRLAPAPTIGPPGAALLVGRRRALLDAIGRHLGDRVEVSGTEAGLHLVLWLRDVRPGRSVDALIGRAARAGVGVYPVAPFYLTPPRRAGLFLGYAGLDETEIRAGIERLAEVLGGRA